MSNHTIELNDYEIANLISVIEAAGYYGKVEPNPLMVINNGDWIGQIYQKINRVDIDPNQSPNNTPQNLAAAAKNHNYFDIEREKTAIREEKKFLLEQIETLEFEIKNLKSIYGAS